MRVFPTGTGGGATALGFLFLVISASGLLALQWPGDNASVGPGGVMGHFVLLLLHYFNQVGQVIILLQKIIGPLATRTDLHQKSAILIIRNNRGQTTVFFIKIVVCPLFMLPLPQDRIRGYLGKVPAPMGNQAKLSNWS